MYKHHLCGAVIQHRPWVQLNRSLWVNSLLQCGMGSNPVGCSTVVTHTYMSVHIMTIKVCHRSSKAGLKGFTRQEPWAQTNHCTYIKPMYIDLNIQEEVIRMFFV